MENEEDSDDFEEFEVTDDEDEGATEQQQDKDADMKEVSTFKNATKGWVRYGFLHFFSLIFRHPQ